MRESFQERAVQKEQMRRIEELPILEQSKMLKKDAEILARDIEFGSDVKDLLIRFRNASAIPEKEFMRIASGTDWSPGMAHALACVFEERKAGKRNIH